MSYLGIVYFPTLYATSLLSLKKKRKKEGQTLRRKENCVFSDHILHHPPEPASFAWEHFAK